MIITQYISHVERSYSEGFKPLTLRQFAALAGRINAVPRGWDKV